MIHTAYLGLGFLATEVLLGWRRRANRTGAVSHDAGTLRLVWVVIAAAVAAAVLVATNVTTGRLESPAWRYLGLIVFLAGLALRWWAILTLGRFFTVDVAITANQQIVRRGPYRLLRHPSYTGLLAAFAGLGLTFGSGPGLAVLMLPITAALTQRIRVEQRALNQRFGAAWLAFCSHTWRLLPFVW